jgi:DNA-binding response OmpR family regulator
MLLQSFYKFCTTSADVPRNIDSVMSFQGSYRDEHCEVNFEANRAFLDQNPMSLTRKEFELLATLAFNAGEIVPREVLLSNVWGYNPEVRTRTLDVHIRRLRKKLGNYGDRYIETIFGIGYRFQPFRDSRPFYSHLNVA